MCHLPIAWARTLRRPSPAPYRISIICSTQEQPLTNKQPTTFYSREGTTELQNARRTIFIIMSRPLSQLEVCLTQYDILKNIAGHIGSADLYKLAIISRTTWLNIRGTRNRWDALAKQGSCDGYGVIQRTETTHYDNSSQKFPLKESLLQKCGATDEGVLSRPCELCGYMTCDECRTHLCYTTPSKGPDPKHNHHIAILDVLPISLRQRIVPLTHDGDLSIFGSSVFPTDDGDIEDVRRGWENKDLGRYMFVDGQMSAFALSRCRFACTSCADVGAESPALQAAGKPIQEAFSSGGHSCCCTFKGHLVGRWVCLRCSLWEFEHDYGYSKHNPCAKNLSMRLKLHQARELASCAYGIPFDGFRNVVVFLQLVRREGWSKLTINSRVEPKACLVYA